MKKIYIIAEIGCNHNGDKELAKKLIVEAKNCGVDAVKFQTFNADALISKYAPKAEYQKVTTGTNDSQLEMTKKFELPHMDYLELKQYASGLGLDVFSTPFDMESIEFLYNTGQNVWKIPSGEITNLPYLEKIGGLKCGDKEIILSTGMSSIEEIEKAVKILVDHGTHRQDIVLLHCNTEYPTPDEDVNILSICALKEKFPDMRIGFSDHSVGYVAAVAAITAGAEMLEKHFTVDKSMPGPDHRASATPEEMKELCVNVRRIENMLGEKKKIVTKSEKKNRIVARKSIVAKQGIKKGEVLTDFNIICKRPGNGISPLYWYEVIGRKAERDFMPDELIVFSDLPNQES